MLMRYATRSYSSCFVMTPVYDGIGTPFMPVSSVRMISRSVHPVR